MTDHQTIPIESGHCGILREERGPSEEEKNPSQEWHLGNGGVEEGLGGGPGVHGGLDLLEQAFDFLVPGPPE